MSVPTTSRRSPSKGCSRGCPVPLDDVVLGDANGAGEDNRDVARMAVLLAGLPTSIPGVTVNRLCGSSLEAAIQAARAIEPGDASLIVAGGVESMSRAPWVLEKPARGFPAAHQTLHSTTLGWRMVNPRMPDRWTISLGESAEKLAGIHSIGREAQDAFALRSHERAAAAWREGLLSEIVQVPGAALERGDARAATALGREPLARIASRAAHGVDPDVFGIGPVRAAQVALERAGIGWDDVDVVELNEAFASQSLACLAGWPQLDPERVNVYGGAIAIGHPLGASGARILGRLALTMAQREARYGLAAVCIGVGQGLAVVLAR